MKQAQWNKETFERLKDEYLLKDSEFMNRLHDFQKSIFLYYKKYKKINSNFKNHNYFYYVFDIISLYRLKCFLKEHNYEKYIEEYLNDNQGWYSNNFIPKNKVGKEVEIMMGMHSDKIITGKLNGYGFHLINRNGVTYGWMAWVKRWRFLKDDMDREVENLDSKQIKRIKK